jgi:hypothetical protein
VICARCGHDSKAKERTGGACPSCHKQFAFPPGGLFTDRAFAGAIEAVSASGHLRFGVEHLYYELCRRAAKHNTLGRLLALATRWIKALALTFVALLLLGVLVSAVLDTRGRSEKRDTGVAIFLVGTVIFGFLAGRSWLRLARSPRPYLAPLAHEEFEPLWQRWLDVHGSPAGLIVRRQAPPQKKRPVESDIGDYSFDRAVICDRARTVDLLLANNFHFENNCAVLAISGYPAGPFETVRAMLKRNPRLHVFALHDATPNGCRMAFRLAHDPAWFHGHVPVTDVGLRPRHASPFNGLLLRAEEGPVAAGQGLTGEEAVWLSKYSLELAAIRPEQVLKRLYRALNQKKDAADDSSFGDSGVAYDNDSFIADAGDSDSGADSFG